MYYHTRYKLIMSGVRQSISFNFLWQPSSHWASWPAPRICLCGAGSSVGHDGTWPVRTYGRMYIPDLHAVLYRWISTIWMGFALNDVQKKKYNTEYGVHTEYWPQCLQEYYRVLRSTTEYPRASDHSKSLRFLASPTVSTRYFGLSTDYHRLLTTVVNSRLQSMYLVLVS